MGLCALRRTALLTAIFAVALTCAPVAADPPGFASISGTSFEDSNADGTLGPADSGAEDFVVYVDLDDDGERDLGEPSDASAADGAWRIDGLLPGTYRVRQLAREEWTCSAPSGCARHVVVAGVANVSGLDFGAWRLGRILGMAYEDSDRDGVRDVGEPAHPRASIYIDANGNGVRDPSETMTASGVDGSFAFSGLGPGEWTLRQVLAAGVHCSAPSPCAHSVTVRSGEDVSGRDFGNWREPAPEPPSGDTPDPDEPSGPKPLTIGLAALYASLGANASEETALGRETDPETGHEIYLVDRTGPCVPVRFEIPVDADPGPVTQVRLTLSPPDGARESFLLERSQSADSVWGGTIACARDGDLHLAVTTPEGETPVRVGEIVLVDPSGTVYDSRLYTKLRRAGESVEAARCGSALSGATVTLQRRENGRFQRVSPSSGDIMPSVNPQKTDADGSYRWDFAAGEYRVRVAKRGYHPAISESVSVPPPVLDLHVALRRKAGTRAPKARECGESGKAAADPGDARERCLARPVSARVRGRTVRRVVFYLDGRHVKTVERPNRAGLFEITVQRRSLDAGRHVLRAKVVFVRRAQRRPAFLTLPIRRCAGASAPKVVKASPAPDCGARPFLAWVRGDRIRQVAFRLDGRGVGSVGVADWRGRYGLMIDPTALTAGRHEVAARIEFVPGSGMRARTVKLSFTKCR